MADLEARLQRLEDEAAIARLIASYGPLADGGRARDIAALWVEDGEYAVAGHGRASGQREIAALIEGPVHQQLMAQGCAHVLSPHRISLDGDTALATGYSVVFRHTPGGFEAWRVSANRWQLVRTGEGWRVASRENAPLDGNRAAAALLEMSHDT